MTARRGNEKAGEKNGEGLDSTPRGGRRVQPAESCPPGQPHEEIRRMELERAELIAVLEQERTESVLLSRRRSEVEAQYARLLRFHIAIQRLLATRSPAELFAAVVEIVANLVGSEETGIFRVDDHSRLVLTYACGLEEADFANLPPGTSLIWTAALHGQPYFHGQDAEEPRLPQEANLSACIPLTFHERQQGAIAVFRLLPQKTLLQAGDRELLCLLGRLAAVVLLCHTDPCQAVRVKGMAQ